MFRTGDIGYQDSFRYRTSEKWFREDPQKGFFGTVFGLIKTRCWLTNYEPWRSFQNRPYELSPNYWQQANGDIMISETVGARESRVVIVGGGFAGLAAAKALRKTPARIFLIDRTNHHLFQPLLYQVATSVLSPGHIGFPIRGLLRKQKNATVLMAEGTGVDKEQRCVFVNDADRQRVPIPYEAEEDPKRHRDLLTFVLVGAGPTGVEMAGAIAVLVRSTLRSEFRRIDPASTRIVLIDMANRIIGSFSERLSNAARKRLEKLGVEVRLGHGVDQIDEGGVIVAGERIASRTVIWTAGVAPSPAGKWLEAKTDRTGRLRVNQDLTVPGHPEVFVIGDTASFDQDGKPLPGVAQVAIQQGCFAGNLIHRRLRGKSAEVLSGIPTKVAWLWWARVSPFCKPEESAWRDISPG
jgi:NADH dehydrogenase FAD-containing subunit